MEKIAYIWISGSHVHCRAYVDGRPDSSLSLPQKDLWDFPNLLRGLGEHNFAVKYSSPPGD
ncbi:MAG: hypothetical protein QT00_C0002G0438 [archaeon GW2011_AR5]|nr:MAG: hypothetical protein QT00_C0002G0438 [archaeon GW2011_AR5]